MFEVSSEIEYSLRLLNGYLEALKTYSGKFKDLPYESNKKIQEKTQELYDRIFWCSPREDIKALLKEEILRETFEVINQVYKHNQLQEEVYVPIYYAYELKNILKHLEDKHLPSYIEEDSYLKKAWEDSSPIWGATLMFFFNTEFDLINQSSRNANPDFLDKIKSFLEKKEKELLELDQEEDQRTFKEEGIRYFVYTECRKLFIIAFQNEAKDEN